VQGHDPAAVSRLVRTRASPLRGGRAPVRRVKQARAATSRPTLGAERTYTAVWPGSCRVTGCELDRPPSTAMACPLT
jgi:hypothetical protein